MGDRWSTFRRWARWLATFIGFPVAGVVARACVGDVDDLAAAAVGGLVGGAALGAIQAFVGGIGSRDRFRWTVATTFGLSLGLAAGMHLVDYRTDTASLVLMGATCGAAVGVAQALSVPMSARDRLMWAIATPLLWAGGWLVTAQVIVDADRHHAIFGSSGALLVSAASGILVAVRRVEVAPVQPATHAARVAGAS